MITLSDATLKVFKLFDRYVIDKLPIGHYIEQFEIANLANPPKTTNDFVTELLNYFGQFNFITRTGFIVAG
jgi:hypothetical protein